MSHMSQFLAYAQAFEQTFVDDDWRRLEPYFTDDVVYIVTGVPNPCELHGKDAMFRGMKKSLDGFDRKMSMREIVPAGPPVEDGDRLTLSGLVRYRRGDSPVVELRATIVVTYAGDRIARMHDTFALDRPAAEWLGRHAADLDASYT